MSKDNKAHQENQNKTQVNKPVQQEEVGWETAVLPPIPSLQRAYTDPITPTNAKLLQRTIGNQALGRLAIQRKMTVGPVGDKYEQEADAVAKQIVNKINNPSPQTAPANTTQRQEDEEELQMKPLLGISALQRHEEEELQAKGDAMMGGGELSGDVETAVANAKSGGTSLSNPIRQSMDSAFNADFSNVKIHTGQQADTLNRSLSARAFTTGSDIFFRSGEYNPSSSNGQELLAHELTHVVQQGSAQTNQTRGQSKVQRQTGDPVIQRFNIKNWFKKKKKGKDSKDSSSSSQPETESSTDSTETEEKESTVDTSLQDAVEYERNLGSYAFGHNVANEAAKSMVDKMTNAMIKEFDQEDKEHRKQLVDLYGKNKVESAGQVGTEFDSVFAAIDRGNLRERLTALYNVMFGAFKQYITQAMKDKAWVEMEQKGLNVPKLKRRKRQMRFNLGAKDLYRDPGNPLDRKKFSSYQHVGSTRTAKDESSDRTVSDLESSGIGLSDREKTLQFGDELSKGEDISNKKVKWKEGGTYWAVNKKNKWVQKVENSMHMPVVAGPSGSMQKMFQLWEYLNKPTSAAKWRLAVLGWMLSSNDHSFHEMMTTAADFGLPYKPNQVAYMKVNPLTVWELRDHVAKDSLFPHELAFKRKTASGKFNMIDDDYLEDAEDSLEFVSPSDKGAVSGPAAAMIKLYSEFGYLLLNPSKEGGMFVKKKVQHAIDNKDELKHIKKDIEDGKYSVDDLIKEASEMMPMMESALEMLPDWSGDLFRGTGTFNPWSFRNGSSFTFGKFGSSTLDEDTAKDFADNYNKGPYKYILNMKVTAGKDIRELASYAEDEILLPPGSKFSVKDKEKKGKYTYVNMEQTERGGDKLDLGTHEEVIEDDLMMGPTLTYYGTKSVDDYYDTFTDPDEKDYIDPDHEEDVWTEFNYLKDGSYYWAKTAALNAFLNPSAQVEEETEPTVPTNPNAKLLTPIGNYEIPFMGLGGFGSLEPIDKPTYIEITDKNYPDGYDGWENVAVKNLDTGQSGFINFIDLKKYLTSGSESQEEEVDDSFGLPPSFDFNIMSMLEAGGDPEMLVSMGMMAESEFTSLTDTQVVALAKAMGVSKEEVEEQISNL